MKPPASQLPRVPYLERCSVGRRHVRCTQRGAQGIEHRARRLQRRAASFNVQATEEPVRGSARGRCSCCCCRRLCGSPASRPRGGSDGAGGPRSARAACSGAGVVVVVVVDVLRRCDGCGGGRRGRCERITRRAAGAAAARRCCTLAGRARRPGRSRLAPPRGITAAAAAAPAPLARHLDHHVHAARPPRRWLHRRRGCLPLVLLTLVCVGAVQAATVGAALPLLVVTLPLLLPLLLLLLVVSRAEHVAAVGAALIVFVVGGGICSGRCLCSRSGAGSGSCRLAAARRTAAAALAATRRAAGPTPRVSCRGLFLGAGLLLAVLQVREWGWGWGWGEGG